MSFWDKIVAQNRIDCSYITELFDISYSEFYDDAVE